MYENDKKDYVQFDESMPNPWRRRHEWPTVLGEHGDSLSLMILIVSIVPSALFGSAPFMAAFYYLVFANVLMYYKLSIGELIMWVRHLMNAEKLNVPSIRQRTIFALPIALFLFAGSPDVFAVEIIKATEPKKELSKEAPLGSFFIDNSKLITGHGDVNIKTLLDVIVVSNFDYRLVFDDKEIETMMVSWRSLKPRELTIDQILGSLSVRYGIYFYTTRGSSELHIAWLRDTAECKKRDGVYLRLCGIDSGKY